MLPQATSLHTHEHTHTHTHCLHDTTNVFLTSLPFTSFSPFPHSPPLPLSLQAATNWLESPAVSRDGNNECVAVFYDTHDFWHFSSALALFFSFLMLMSLDDDTEGTLRTDLRVF